MRDQVGRKRVSLGIRLGLIMRCPWDRDLEEKRSAFNQDKVKRATNLVDSDAVQALDCKLLHYLVA